VSGALASTFSDTTLPVLIIAGCVAATGALGVLRRMRRRGDPEVLSTDEGDAAPEPSADAPAAPLGRQ
jgi:hypothetical protein